MAVAIEPVHRGSNYSTAFSLNTPPLSASKRKRLSHSARSLISVEPDLFTLDFTGKEQLAGQAVKKI